MCVYKIKWKYLEYLSSSFLFLFLNSSGFISSKKSIQTKEKLVITILLLAYTLINTELNSNLFTGDSAFSLGLHFSVLSALHTALPLPNMNSLPALHHPQNKGPNSSDAVRTLLNAPLHPHPQFCSASQSLSLPGL